MATAHRPGVFHSLPVLAVEPLTDDSVTLTLAVPPELREYFRYAPGQHITVRRPSHGGQAEMRRTYSLCDPADPRGPRTLRVGIRRVEGGEFSGYATKELTAGDQLEVMAPVGRFRLEPRPGRYAAIVGGSGITPVLSIVSTLLARERDARFHLVRSDRSADSTMFLEEVAALKDRWPERFQLASVLSREQQSGGLLSGRLNAERLRTLLPALLPVQAVDGWFLCGPHGLVLAAQRALDGLGVLPARVHQEIFHADEASVATVTASSTLVSNGTSQPADAAQTSRSAASASGAVYPGATVTATLDGRSGRWEVLDGEPLLQTVLRNRSDAPYACRGGVCGTCRAKLVSGEVRMDRNFALEAEEVADGYVLSCQSHPLTEEVTLDFDG